MQTLLVEFCDKNQLIMPSLKYFLVKDAPLENITQFRLWFIDLWNLVLIEALREQLENSGTIEDPVKIIARTLSKGRLTKEFRAFHRGTICVYCS